MLNCQRRLISVCLSLNLSALTGAPMGRKICENACFLCIGTAVLISVSWETLSVWK